MIDDKIGIGGNAVEQEANEGCRYSRQSYTNS